MVCKKKEPKKTPKQKFMDLLDEVRIARSDAYWSEKLEEIGGGYNVAVNFFEFLEKRLTALIREEEEDETTLPREGL